MLTALTTLVQEIALTVKKPRRILALFDPRRLRKYMALMTLKLRVGNVWTADEREGAFKKRSYSSYEKYLLHQSSKLEHADLSAYDVQFREALRERLRRADVVKPGMSVLCIGARLGTEVKAFIDLGCFAVGIDLNPGQGNRYVAHGDFHNLQYAPGSVDVVFTNSLDHAFDIQRLISEIRRVLKPDGLLVVEAVRGSEEGEHPSFYESLWWSKIDDVVALLERSGFDLMNRFSFDYPWPGDHLCFRSVVEHPGSARHR